MNRRHPTPWALVAAALLALGACDRTARSPASSALMSGGAAAATDPSAPSARAPVGASTSGDATRGPTGLPPEPQCRDGRGPTRIPVCFEPQPQDTPAGYPAPYERCRAEVNGHPFSRELTDGERARSEHPNSCCYLDRCQVSYGY